MTKSILFLFITIVFVTSCTKNETPTSNTIKGFDLLEQVNGHWVGTNETAFGFFDWFAFDFRPIAPSHSHSIYEGGTNQNIITSIFLADHEGKQQIMARNGGWLGNQYRATYFVLDKEERNGQETYYKLVDAIGGIDRAYIEFSFKADSIFIDAYKDNSGALDQPIHHMGFAGQNRNPQYADTAQEAFSFPQEVSEVDLNGQFIDLIDPDSALFLEEANDPFPKSDHGHLSDLIINITRNQETMDVPLLLYLSKEELVSNTGAVDLNSLDKSVIRTIDIGAMEQSYTTTYLHPDNYYVTVFSDEDNNGFPSQGDYTSQSTLKTVVPETITNTDISITLLIP